MSSNQSRPLGSRNGAGSCSMHFESQHSDVPFDASEIWTHTKNDSHFILDLILNRPRNLRLPKNTNKIRLRICEATECRNKEYLCRTVATFAARNDQVKSQVEKDRGRITSRSGYASIVLRVSVQILKDEEHDSRA